MVHTGESSYAYWGIEGTVGAGDPSADQNIPFNPTASLTPQKPKYVDVEERTFDSLEPKIVYTGEKAPGEGPIECSFRDPFLLLSFFTHKVVGGTWGTGTGTITADFTAVDDVDTLFLQYHLEDQSGSGNHVNKLLKHGLPMKYSWVVEVGKLLKEIAELKFLDFATNTQAPSISNDFHDQSFGSGVGGWANWDNSGLNGTGKRSPVDMVLHWGGAVLTALKITTMNMSFEVGYETIQTTDSLGHSVTYRTIRNFMITLNGTLNDLTAITEYEKLYSDRTKQTLRLYYDATAGEEKYLQFTNAHISPESSIPPIPEAGKPAEVSLVIKGGEDTKASYSGSFVDRPDPSVLINA